MRIDLQSHGYISGHQILGSSITLDKRDQATVNRLSDVSGPIGPGEQFDPYLSGYPLPSGRYVVARTWPDLDARRAGCVRTLSLILGGDDWASLPSPANLSGLLTQKPTLQGGRLSSQSVDPKRPTLPPVTSPAARALVEALFLEERRPIVCFQEPEAEMMTLRVLEALWPGLRRQFSFCTYALQARTVGNRPFDLLFAPKTARSRFSDWPGRKLDRSSSLGAGDRHVWSRDLTDAVFIAPHPDLRLADSLGVLSADREGDPTALRYAMLWRDLQARAATDPHAVLGMLDLLTAAEVPTVVKTRQAAELFTLAARAGEGMEPLEGMHLLRLLLTKLPLSSHSQLTASQAGALGEQLVCREPGASVLVFDLMVSDLPEADALAIGIANGLARSSSSQLSLDALKSASPEALLTMIEKSAAFQRFVMTADVGGSLAWASILQAIVQAPGLARTKLRQDLLPLVAIPEHSSLVVQLLQELHGGPVTDALDDLLASPGGHLPAIQQAVAETLLPQEAQRVRAAVLAKGRDDVRFGSLLLGTLNPSGDDLDWIAQAGPDEQSVSSLLPVYVAQLPDAALSRFINRDPPSARRLLVSLLAAKQNDPTATARLIVLAPHLAAGFEGAVVRAITALPTRAAQDLLAATLPTLLRLATGSDWIGVQTLLRSDIGASASSMMKAGDLIAALVPALSENIAADRQAMILQGVADLPPRHPLVDKLVRHIASLTSRLATKPPLSLGAMSISLWSDLLETAAQRRSAEAPKAAATTMAYVFEHREASLAPLARASFPIVLWSADQPQTPLDYWSRLFGLEVDNARDLRERIVATYLAMEWPIADLLIGAWDAHAAGKVIRMLKRSRRGAALLASTLPALKRAKDTPKQLVRLVEAELSRVKR